MILSFNYGHLVKTWDYNTSTYHLFMSSIGDLSCITLLSFPIVNKGITTI